MIDKHPINSLVNSETVSDIFLELEDTFKFDVDVQCEMGRPRSRELVSFYELEHNYDYDEPIEEFGYCQRVKAVEKTYEVTTYYKTAIIRVNELYSTIEHSPIILRNDIDLKEIMSRAIEYIGEENITDIYKNNLGVDRNHSAVFVMKDDVRIHLQCPVIIIYFKSYGAKEYK